MRQYTVTTPTHTYSVYAASPRVALNRVLTGTGGTAYLEVCVRESRPVTLLVQDRGKVIKIGQPYAPSYWGTPAPGGTRYLARRWHPINEPIPEGYEAVRRRP